MGAVQLLKAGRSNLESSSTGTPRTQGESCVREGTRPGHQNHQLRRDKKDTTSNSHLGHGLIVSSILKRRASLVVLLVKKLPAIMKTWVRSLVGKIPWRRERLPTPLSWRIPWTCIVHRVTKNWTLLSDFHIYTYIFKRGKRYTHARAHVLSHFSCVQLFAVLWTIAHQAPFTMGFSRQEYWSGLHAFLLEWILLDPGSKSMSLTSPALADWFFTTSATWEAQKTHTYLTIRTQPNQTLV